MLPLSLAFLYHHTTHTMLLLFLVLHPLLFKLFLHMAIVLGLWSFNALALIAPSQNVTFQKAWYPVSSFLANWPKLMMRDASIKLMTSFRNTFSLSSYFNTTKAQRGRSRWARCLRCGLLPLASWDCGFESRRDIDVCPFRVLCVSGLKVGMITRPGDSYRISCVWVWSWSLDSGKVVAHCATEKKISAESSCSAWLLWPWFCSFSSHCLLENSAEGPSGPERWDVNQDWKKTCIRELIDLYCAANTIRVI